MWPFSFLRTASFFWLRMSAVDITGSMSYICFLTPPGRVTAKRFSALLDEFISKPNR